MAPVPGGNDWGMPSLYRRPGRRPAALVAGAALVTLAGCGGGSGSGGHGATETGFLHGDAKAPCVWIVTDSGRIEIMPPGGWKLELPHRKVALYDGKGNLVAVEGQRVRVHVTGPAHGIPGCPLHQGHTVYGISGVQPLRPAPRQ